VIFIISTLEPRALISTSVPHVQFTQYTRDEALTIMQRMNICELPKHALSSDKATAERQKALFWSQYCSIVYDALGAYTGSDLRLLKDVAHRIWPMFIKPIEDGGFRVEEFIRVYKESEYLFISEIAVTDSLVDTATDDALRLSRGQKPRSSELPVESKFILCAAYLASYNPPRYDVRFFSKAKEARAKRRDTGRRKKLKINPRSLAAPAFDLERMLAILRSIFHSGVGAEYQEEYASNIDIGVQIATLTTLKLIVRTSSSDPLDSRTRWKVNSTWSFIKQLADEIDLPIEEFLIE